MKRAVSFDQIVGMASELDLPQKESLVEILSRRLVEERRASLRSDIQAATREFRSNKFRVPRLRAQETIAVVRSNLRLVR